MGIRALTPKSSVLLALLALSASGCIRVIAPRDALDELSRSSTDTGSGSGAGSGASGGGPVSVSTNAVLVAVEAGSVAITTSDLDFSATATASAVTLTLVTAPTRGLIYNTRTSAAISASGTFTLDDLRTGKIQYRHDGTEIADNGGTSSDAFTVIATSGTYDSGNVNVSVTVHTICYDKSSATTYNAYGSGTSASPYILCTAAQLNDLGARTSTIGGAYWLRSNIDMSSIPGNHNRIGDGVTSWFTGTFDGNGNTISNWTYIDNTQQYVGLFGYVQGNQNYTERRPRNITDVNLVGVNIQCHSNCGALVGYAANYAIIGGSTSSGTVSASGGTAGSVNVGGLIGYAANTGVYDCHSSATVSSDGSYLGGLIGKMGTKGAIAHSYATGTVTGTAASDYVGGLAGYVYGRVDDSYATGNVSGHDDVGGLLGYQRSDKVRVSYATGSVTGNASVGGLIGETLSSLVYDSYARGAVSGDSHVAGFIGKLASSDVARSYSSSSVTFTTSGAGFFGSVAGSTYSNNFWDTQTSVQANAYEGSGGSAAGITGQTTGQMKTLATFTGAGWDFVGEGANGTNDYWGAAGGGAYPTLFSQVTLPASSLSGAGTQTSPYLIATTADFASIGDNPRYLGAYFKVTANLDMNAVTYQPMDVFWGDFDGNRKQISNLSYNGATPGIGGLTNNLVNGVIRNLRLTIVSLQNTQKDTGGIAGNAYLNSAVLDSSVVGSGAGPHIHSIGNNTGGLVGNLTAGSIIMRSFADTVLEGNNNSGGLVANFDQDTMIKDSYARGSVQVSGNTVGGLIGTATGGSFNRCYSSNIQIGATIGGLVGTAPNLSYGSDYYDTTVGSADSISGTGSVPGLTGKTTAQLMLQATYTGWDFTSVWTTSGDTTLPTLR